MSTSFIIAMLSACVLVASLPAEENSLMATADYLVPAGPKVETDFLQAALTSRQARASKKVNQLMQQGNDENACSQMAQTALDTVTASVKAQQDTLDAMDKGANCDAAGDSVKAAAEATRVAAADAVSGAEKTLASAQSTTVDLGSYEWQQLDANNCASLFNIAAYTSVTETVNVASQDLTAKQGALSAAVNGITTADTEAEVLISECKCNVLQAHDEALTKMNEDAKAENTEAWTQAKHIQCVLAGTLASNCDIGTVPSVTETNTAEGVAEGCSTAPFVKTLGAKQGIGEKEWKFQRVKMDTQSTNNYQETNTRVCDTKGTWPVCDHPSYCRDDARSMYIGQDHHFSHGSHLQTMSYFPSGFAAIQNNWKGACNYAASANGVYDLCNNNNAGSGNGMRNNDAIAHLWGSHDWLLPSGVTGTGVDGLQNEGSEFVCAKINHKEVVATLGAKNGNPETQYKFKMVTANHYGSGEINHNMVSDCNAIGMKPVCEHQNYCKSDDNSIYIGQDHHFSHGSHRKELSYWPSGWSEVMSAIGGEMEHMCTYSGANGNGWGNALCENEGDSHTWRTRDTSNQFLCAKKMS